MQNGNSLIQTLRENNLRVAGKIALIENAGQLSYGELWKRVDEMAETFAGLKIDKDKIVLAYLDNSINLAVVFLALLKCQAVPFIINRDKIQTIDFENLNFYCIISTVRDSELKEAIHFSSTTANLPQYGFSILFRQQARRSRRSNISGSVLVTSSGSTGTPKIILLPTQGILQNIKSNARSIGIRPTDTTLIILPMSYSYGLIGQFLTHLYMNASIVFTSSKIYMLQITTLVSRYKVTTLFTVPLVLRQFLALAHPANVEAAFESLRLITIGGNHADEFTVRNALAFFKKPLVKTYGLAEAGPRVSTKYIYPDKPFNFQTVGKPIDKVQVEALDERGKKLERGQVGRISISSPCVFSGYLNSNANHYTPNKTVLTSDYGYVNEEGELVILGKKNNFLTTTRGKLWFSEMENPVYATGKVSKVSFEKTGKNGVLLNILPVTGAWLTPEEISELLASRFGEEIKEKIKIEFITLTQLKVIK